MKMMISKMYSSNKNNLFKYDFHRFRRENVPYFFTEFENSCHSATFTFFPTRFFSNVTTYLEHLSFRLCARSQEQTSFRNYVVTVRARSQTTLTRGFFDHLPSFVDIFYLMNVDKKSTFSKLIKKCQQ